MHLKRADFELLKRWYETPLRKMPAILFGARQVGKSTLAAEFAHSTKRQVITVNFWKDEQGVYRRLFSEKRSAAEIISGLEVILGQRIEQDKCLLILDEIQACPTAYSLCKSFKEDSDLPLIATGSYLKLLLRTLGEGEDEPDIEIPVGCTYEKLITPLSFAEYLLNRNEPLFTQYQTLSIDEKVDDFTHEQLLKIYYEYLFVGGMPEAVSIFLRMREESLQAAIGATREIHSSLLSGYQNDFLNFRNQKLIRRNVAEKLHYTFATIAAELHKYRQSNTPVKRFRFTSLGKSTEYRRVSNVFEYLARSGLIIRSYVIANAEDSLFAEETEKNAFKCFYFDIGVLNAQLRISYRTIIEDEWNNSKGPIAENFVAQELYHYQNQELLSWKAKNYEVEFLQQSENSFIPIEVKGSKKSLPSASLAKYCEYYKPEKAYKVAPRNFGNNKGFVSLPIYFAGKISSRDAGT